jgi:pimeloyl-ACP methyl ester carboxylesterase
VFLLHGSPGSRVGPKPPERDLCQLGVQLVCYDRPGYGGSDRRCERAVADAVIDMATVADELGFDRFGVVGRSGGGPHALAAAALLPDRVHQTVVLVGLAPPDAVDLDWFRGMTPANVHDYKLADLDEKQLVERLRMISGQERRQPGTYVDLLRAQMIGSDRRVVSDVTTRRGLTEAYVEAFRSGPHGWVDDILALRSDWGFRPEAIRGSVLLWHGADDNFVPAGHTRWLAARIPGCEAIVESGAGHFGAVSVLPEMLAMLVRRAP